jgi:hypothetical protein
MAGLNDFDLAAFVEASCRRHGVPVKVSDSGVHRDVALLLSGRTDRGAAPAALGRRAVSDSPDKINPVGVEAATTDVGGCNDGVIEDCSDDRVLTGEVEFGPLGA